VPLSLGSDVTIGHNATWTGASSRTRSSSAWARSCSTGRTWDVTIIAAGALLTEGQQVPEGVLVAGVPGKVRRELSEAERAAIERNAAFYVELAELHHRGGM
jgi:carbonic anhydrase/acetyltransferase-like protein (isoleucine patch superfamily)